MRKDWMEARARAAEIVERFRAGMTIRELAGRYKLTYMRVHQIVTPVFGPRREPKKQKKRRA